jgi:hypothetical protein
MKYIVEIDTDNDEFRHGMAGTVVSRLLRHVADEVHVGGLHTIKLFDINGNEVGIAKCVKEEK